MAVTKTLTKTASNGNHSFSLTVTETATSTANNTSTVSYTFKIAPVDTGWNWTFSNQTPVSYTFKINGISYNGSIMSYDGYSTVTLKSGTQTVTHNSDGSKTINLSFSVTSLSGYSYLPGSASSSGTLALTDIARYATITSFSISAKTETSLTCAWKADATVDTLKYSTDGGSTWVDYNTADGKSGSFKISSLSANTSYALRLRVRRKDSGLVTPTASASALSAATYNWPYCKTMPDFTIGNSVKLTFYNPLGRTFTFYTTVNGTQIGTSYSTDGTTYTAYGTATAQIQLYATIPSDKSATYSIKCTYSSHNVTKTGGTVSVDEATCKPTISSLTYVDTNATTIAITGDSSKIVQNASKVTYTATGLSAKNSATISSVKVAINGSTYNMTVSGTTATGGGAVVNSGSDIKATATITDSRGLKATKSVTVKMLPWSTPSARISLVRHNNYYTATDITVNATYASLNGGNSITIKYRKKRAGGSWGAWESLSDGVTTTFNADNNYSWSVRVNLEDVLGAATTYNLTLGRGVPIIYFDRLNESVGIECIPTGSMTLETAGDIYEAGTKLSAKYNAKRTVDYSMSGSSSVISDKSLASGSSWTNLGSFTLDAGIHLVIVYCDFASNATGRRAVGISSSSGGSPIGLYNRQNVAATNGGDTSVRIVCFFNTENDGTVYYVNAIQNSGSALTVKTRIASLSLG